MQSAIAGSAAGTPLTSPRTRSASPGGRSFTFAAQAPSPATASSAPRSTASRWRRLRIPPSACHSACVLYIRLANASVHRSSPRHSLLPLQHQQLTDPVSASARQPGR